MHWDNSERDIQEDSRGISQLRTAIGVSLVLHGVILAMVLWLMDLRTQNGESVIPATVKISLLQAPEVPDQQAPLSEAAQPEYEPVPPGEIKEVADSEPVEPPAERGLLPEPLVELPQLADTPIAAGDDETISEPVRIPDALALRQTVRQVHQLQNSEAVMSNCTPAQHRNDLFDCPDPLEPDYTEAFHSPIYLSFNQPQADDQSRRAMGTVAGNQRQLRSGIQAFSLDGVDNDYLLEELSQGIEVYSGTGNTRLERLTDQIYRNDPVYQQAKRIMTPR